MEVFQEENKRVYFPLEGPSHEVLNRIVRVCLCGSVANNSSNVIGLICVICVQKNFPFLSAVFVADSSFRVFVIKKVSLPLQMLGTMISIIEESVKVVDHFQQTTHNRQQTLR